MKSRFLIIAVLAALAVPIASAQSTDSTIRGGIVDPQVMDTLTAAGDALGMVFYGNSDNIVAIEFWASGTHYPVTSGRQGTATQVSEYHAGLDYAAPPGGRIEYVLGGQRHIEAVTVDSGNVRQIFAWNESEWGGGTSTPMLDDAEARWLQYWSLSPHAVIKAAINVGELVQVSRQGNNTVFTFPFDTASCRDPEIFSGTEGCEVETVTFTVTLDSNNLVQRVQTRSNRSDRLAGETTYSDYGDLSERQSGKPFPAHIVHRQGGFTVWDLMVTRADLDFPPVYVFAPDNVRQAAIRRGNEAGVF